MTATIFAGPTVWGCPIPGEPAFRWLPPASEGDIYRAAREKPRAIGLIDGRFETAPSVWHKEILWALTQGIHVFGAASMGALRAAELDSFGMIGVGTIYQDYRNGVLQDDDEVAVIHAPAEFGYRPLSEAMVDIRAAIESAHRAHVISRRTADTLLRIGKGMFFKERSWSALLRLAADENVPRAQLSVLARWVPAHRVERKQSDALALIATMRRFVEVERRPFRPKFAFQHTVYWQALVDLHRH